MKVVIINKSDVKGGAAVVSNRLMKALCAEGVDARMLVLDKQVEDERVTVATEGWRDRYRFLAERLHIFVNNRFSRENLFKVSTALWGQDLSKHRLVRGADVIMLNWVNQGAMSLKAIERLCALGKPVIWTMHDMWECTGICHHAFSCQGYKAECGCCPFLGSSRPKDLATRVQAIKKGIYDKSNIHFVAVSDWLAGRCRESTLLRDKDVRVIYNAFPLEEFHYEREHEQFLDIPPDKHVIVMGAARLDDPIKGFGYLIDALRYIADEKPELATKLHLLLYGGIRDESLLEQIAIPITYMGSVKGVGELVRIYTHADMVVSTSLYETSGATLVEGQACGCTPVTFGEGGQTSIVEHERSGYIADYKSARSIADGIEWAVEHPCDRKAQHQEAARHFSGKEVAGQYIALCEELLSGK